MDRRKIVEQILSELRKNPVEDCVLELLPDHEILLILEEAFRAELNAGVRYNIIENIVGLVGQRRASAAMPILTEALYDESPWVWKKALDGLVFLGQPECVQVMEAARNRPFRRVKDSKYFQEYLDEALQQLREGVFGEKKAPFPAPDIAED